MSPPGRAAVITLHRSLPAVLATLQNQSHQTAVGLLKMCSKYMFIATMQLLSDVLARVDHLSLAFQCTLVDLSIIYILLSTTLTTLEKLEDEAPTTSEEKVRSLIARMNVEVTELHVEGDDFNANSDDRETEPPIIITTPSEPQYFETQVRQKFLSQMIVNLQERIPLSRTFRGI